MWWIHMKTKGERWAGLVGWGLGAVVAGPAGGALGTTLGVLAGGALGPLLEPLGDAIGNAAGGVAGNLFAARLDAEPYDGFNHDLLRALGRALQASLSADAVRRSVESLAVYDSVVGLQRKSLRHYFEVWDRELARINSAAENGDHSQLAGLFPKWDEATTARMVDEARNVATEGEAWARLVAEVLVPMLAGGGDGWLPPAELRDRGAELARALGEALAGEFPHRVAEQLKAPAGRRAWIAFQKLLLQRLDRRIGEIATTAAGTRDDIAALRAELAVLTDGARDAAAGEKQAAFFARAEQGLSALAAQVADEGRRTREHVSAENAALGQKIDGLAASVDLLVKAEDRASAASICTLPSPPSPFVGRVEELRDLRALAERGEGVAIVGLRGMGGVGKTGLALVLAHALRSRYSAALYLNLQGLGDPTDPNPVNRPLSPELIVSALLRALRVEAVDKIDPAAPGGWQQLQGLYRAELSSRPTLLLLDNAKDAAQVAPVLPPAGCLLLVTAREAFGLNGVSARRIGTLSAPEAERLLRELCLRLTEEQAATLAKHCAHLPKALRAAAGRLAVEEDLEVDEYLRLLADEKRRLRQLGREDGDELDVEATLRLSIQRLSEIERRAFARLAAFGPLRFVAESARHVIEDEEGGTLHRLVRLSLVEWDEATKFYGLHDLLRLIAADLLGQAAEEDRIARLRHAAWHAAVLGQANALLIKGGSEQLMGLRTFDLFRDSILLAQGWVIEHANPENDALAPALVLPQILALRVHPREREAGLRAALAATRRRGDRQAEANMLQAQGDLAVRQGRPGEAEKAYEAALGIYREIGDRLGEANVLQAQGDLELRQGRLGEAEKGYGEALGIFREIGDRQGMANVLQAQGDLAVRQGRLGGAEKAYGEALGIYREIGDRLGAANVLQAQGDQAVRQDRLGEGEKAYEAALGIFREIGERLGEANVLRAQGDLAVRQGGQGEAEKAYGDALAIFREIGERLGEANVLKAQGDLALRQVRLGEAEKAYEAALGIFREIGERLGEANVLQSIGRSATTAGKFDEGISRLLEALRNHREIGAQLGVAADLGYLAQALLQSDRAPQALVAAEDALHILRGIGDRWGERITLETVVQCFGALDESWREPLIATAWLVWRLSEPLGLDPAQGPAGIIEQIRRQADAAAWGEFAGQMEQHAEAIRARAVQAVREALERAAEEGGGAAAPAPA